jgi:integrase
MASIYRRKKGGCFYITYQARPGERHTVKGCKDRAATEALARKLEADAMLRRAGIIDPKADRYAAAEAKPLKDHLADLIAALEARGVTTKQTENVKARVTHIVALCKTEHISQISPSAVQRAIGTIREAGASKRSRKKGASLQTCNHYLRAVKQFTRWLWRDGRACEDPLAHLSGFNVQLDRRHDRRAFTDDELARLVEAAEQGPVVKGVDGTERVMLYLVAVGTGFRANELRSLTPESFDLDADPPTVTVQAGYSKRRRKDVQPIRQDLAGRLRVYLACRDQGRPVFVVPHDAAKMLRADLSAAHECWLKESRSPEERRAREQSDFLAYRNSAGGVADFHALRHTYVSRLVRSGANIKVAQELARHSTPMLTLGRYAHMEIVDQRKALDALPAINAPRANVAALAATGS